MPPVLSDKQLKILQGRADDQTYKQIANALGSTEDGIKNEACRCSKRFR
jgi:transcriptional regulator